MELIKLPIILGLEITKILQAKGIEPKKNDRGIFTCEFTEEELDLITEITINVPSPNCLKGLENCKKLERLTIKTPILGAEAYVTNNPSISDKDIKVISKLTSLKHLEITNQSKISWLDLSNLVNLEELIVTINNSLEDVYGLTELKKVREVSIYGNKELYELPNIQQLIMSNDLECLELDLLTYPEVFSLHNRLLGIGHCKFKETVNNGNDLSYPAATAYIFHDDCLRILDDILKLSRNHLEALILVEKYLAENITYDDKAWTEKTYIHHENGEKRGLKFGTQSAFNALKYGSCVCEGYTRAMQYLLKNLKIKTKNVYCVEGKDRIQGDNFYHNLPKDGYHSIIRIDLDNNVYYCDPCWDSSYWHAGIKTLPYCLKSKKDILKDHTLSFEEDNISVDGSTISVDPSFIKDICRRSEMMLESEKTERKR